MPGPDAADFEHLLCFLVPSYFKPIALTMPYMVGNGNIAPRLTHCARYGLHGAESVRQTRDVPLQISLLVSQSDRDALFSSR